jgi:hypothetical protein
LSLDPLAPDYPWNSPYAFSENRVIDCIELEGLEIFYAADGSYIGTINNGSAQVRYVSCENVEEVSKNIRWANHQLSVKGKYVWANTKKALDNSVASPFQNPFSKTQTPTIFSSGQRLNANEDKRLDPAAVTGPVADNTSVVMPRIEECPPEDVNAPPSSPNNRMPIDDSGPKKVDPNEPVDGLPGEKDNSFSGDEDSPGQKQQEGIIEPFERYERHAATVSGSRNITRIYLRHIIGIKVMGKEYPKYDTLVSQLYWQRNEVFRDSMKILEKALIKPEVDDTPK